MSRWVNACRQRHVWQKKVGVTFLLIIMCVFLSCIFPVILTTCKYSGTPLSLKLNACINNFLIKCTSYKWSPFERGQWTHFLRKNWASNLSYSYNCPLCLLFYTASFMKTRLIRYQMRSKSVGYKHCILNPLIRRSLQDLLEAKGSWGLRDVGNLSEADRLSTGPVLP